MDGGESREELNYRIRKQLCECFGTFEEFHEKVSRSVQHGLIRSKMKSRTSPFVPLQMVHDSPSHVPIHVALQSMRNLVDEPLSALPTELMSLKTLSSPATAKTTPSKQVEVKSGSGSSNKRRLDTSSSAEKQQEPRRKSQKIPNPEQAQTTRDDEDANNFSPDSGVHSAENETDESATVENMLNIMTSLEEPRISPIPDTFLRDRDDTKYRIRAESTPKKEAEEPKKSSGKPPVPQVQPRFPPGSSTSSASTSREVSPDAPRPKPTSSHHHSHHRKSPIVTGHLKLDGLKSEKIKKLIKLADQHKKLEQKKPENGRPSSGASGKSEPSRAKEEEKKPPKDAKPLNKAVFQLTSEVKQSPSTASPRSNPSSMNTPTLLSRPSSSLSTHDPSASTASQPKQPRWSCQWEHSKLKSVQRVPIPDPTVPNPKSKGDFYHEMAKDWKSKADKSKDRVLRPLNYMLSSVFFVLEAIWKTEKERTPQARMLCASIYRDTCELLGVAVFQGVKDSDDPLAVHILPRIKILGQIMLSVMQYQYYVLRADQAIKNYSRLETPEVANSIETHTTNGSSANESAAQGWAASLANSSSSVTMPLAVYNLMKTQIKTANSLILASRYWEDAKILSKQVDDRFVKHIESVCGRSIGMDTSFDVLAQFVLTAVGSLKSEYEEEHKLPVRPVLAKVKPVLEFAVKTGSFHSSAGDRSHRTSQSTPRIATTGTSTPTPAQNHTHCNV